MIKIDLKVECDSFDEYFDEAIPALIHALKQAGERRKITDPRIVGIVMTMRDDGSGLRCNEVMDIDIDDPTLKLQ